MARLLTADSAALLEAPLKFAVLEPTAGVVSVRWSDPTAAFARYEHPALNDLGRELASVCEGIVTAALTMRESPSVS
jgi:hypothetical protein